VAGINAFICDETSVISDLVNIHVIIPDTLTQTTDKLLALLLLLLPDHYLLMRCTTVIHVSCTVFYWLL